MTKLDFVELIGKLKLIAEAAREHNSECYLVGGFLRDLFLQRPTKDLDFAVSKNPKSLSKKIAEELDASFFILKEEREIYRVITKDGYQLDFAKFKGPTIEEDLSQRDFPINAMAVKLPMTHFELPITNLIDPYEGEKDIEKKIVRQISPKIYDDDPLRMLRAFRIATQLDFQIDLETLHTIKENKKQIQKPAVERIREEILLILDCSHSYPTIQKFDEAGLISEIFPEVDPNRECALQYYPGKGVWGHSLDALECLEWIFENLRSEFPENFEKISAFLFQQGDGTEGHQRAALMKLAALLHDVGKAPTAKMIKGRMRFLEHQNVGAEIARRIARRLKFSSDTVSILSKTIQAHMRPGGLAQTDTLTERAKYRFFRDLGISAIPALLISLADRYTYLLNDRGKNTDPHEKTTKEMIRWYAQKELEQSAKKEKLIDGHILMQELKLEPGPLIGEILKNVEEAHALNEITTSEEAIEFSKKWLSNHPKQNAKLVN